MSWELFRGSVLPWDSLLFRICCNYFQGGPTLDQFSWHPNSRHRCLGCCHHSEEKRNLASRTTLPTEVWQSLVSPLPNVTRRCSALRFVHRRTVVTNYPFLLFLSTIAIPTAYWIAIIELGILSENDDSFSLMFGQVRLISTPGFSLVGF